MIQKSLRTLLFASFGVFPLATVLAAQDGDLRPVQPGSPGSARYAAVGRVLFGHGQTLSMASGFLISPCHVLTAGHVLAKLGRAAQIDAEVRFVPEVQNKRTVVGRVLAASQDFVMNENPQGFDQQRIPNDWALIELERAIPEIEPMQILYPGASVPAESTYSIAGYPLGQLQQGLFAQESCKDWASAHGGVAMKNMLLFDCAVRAGMSGGPVLLDGKAGTLALGVVTERFSMGQNVMTIAVPISAFAAQIEDVIRNSEVCAVGSPFVWP